MSIDYVNLEIDSSRVDNISAFVADGIRRHGAWQSRQDIVKLLKSEAAVAYEAGDDDDFADGITHAYKLIEKMDEE